MNDKRHLQKTSVDDVAQGARVAIDDVTGRAKKASKKLADATREVVTAVGEQVESSGKAAVRKIKRAARKLDDSTHDARKVH